jgi:hypothetical protein
MNRGRPHVKLPPGFEEGMRIVTNATYALVNPKSPQHRTGTILCGSNGRNGSCIVKLDDMQGKTALAPALFDIVK